MRRYEGSFATAAELERDGLFQRPVSDSVKSFAAVCLLASSLAAQTIAISDTAAGAAGSFSANPFVASNGQTFVIAWQESSALVVGRADAATHTLQTQAIDAYIPFVRGVVPVSSGFLVFFTSNGGNVIRLNARGEVEGAAHQVLERYSVSAASNGDRVLAVNEAGEGVILSAAGDVLVSGLRLSTAEPYTAQAWATAAARDRFLYAEWTSSSEVRVSIVATDGRIVSTSVFANEPISSGLAAASDGEEFVVAWRTPDALRAASTAAGQVRTVVPVSVFGNLDVVWSGAEYVALVNETTTIRRVRFARDLGVTGDDVIVDEPRVNHGSQRLAIGGGQTLAAWHANATCADGYGWTALSWNGAPPQIATIGTADNLDPIVAAGRVPLILWRELRERGRRRGAMVDGGPRAIVVQPDPAASQAVASDGSGFLAAYVSPASDCTDQLTIEALDGVGNVIAHRVIGPSGGSTGGIYPSAQFTPAVAWNGSEYLVAWMAAGGSSIAGIRVSATGTLLDDTPQTLTMTTEPGYLTPRLAWAANRWNLVWWRSFLPYIPWYPGPPTVNVISLRQLDRDLQPLGADVVVAPRGWSPAVASDGSNLFVAWRDAEGLHGGFPTADGMLNFPATLRDFRPYATSVTAAAAGGAFYVLDLDRLYVYDRASFTPLRFLPARVSTSAVVRDGGSLVIAWAADRTIYSTSFVVSQPRRRIAPRR
ncbi:MAG TPA: hypothetical protein VLV78_17965 [Thermoanaerobaculia bacterium]|nr:hypothetical protein [Thermoanaerobaculia bacterium]